MVAHRLTTLKECETIFLLEEGRLIDQGTYDHLMATNMTFKRMAREEVAEETLGTGRAVKSQ